MEFGHLEGVLQPDPQGPKPMTMVMNHVSKFWDDPPSHQL